MAKRIPKLASIDDIMLLNENCAINFDRNDDSGSERRNAVTEIEISKLKPFENYPFKAIEGERFSDMVDSIKNNGILIPLIVRKINGTSDGFYEILSGHNRFNAAIEAGLTKVPVLIKEDIDDDVAIMYVTESNLIQRSFSDMLPSEQAYVLSIRHSQLFSQGKRSDIIEELKRLEGKCEDESESCSPMAKRLKTIEKVGVEYGLGKDSVARLLRINKLSADLKELVDKGEICIRAGVSVSYLDEEKQSVLSRVLKDNELKLDMKKAEMLRELGESCGSAEDGEVGEFTEERIIQIFYGEKLDESEKEGKVGGGSKRGFSISQKIFKKYFTAKQEKKEVEDIIDKALEMYFGRIGELGSEEVD